MQTDVLTGREIEEAFDLTPAQRRFWTNGAVFNISPSGSRNLKGVTALFELRDAYLFGLVVAGIRSNPNASFSDVGTLIDKIKADPEWDFWQKDRGVLKAVSFKWPKELLDANGIGPDGWKINYISRTKINNGFLQWTKERATTLGAAIGSHEIAYEFLLNCPEFPNTPEAIEALMTRAKTITKAPARGEIGPASTEMSYQFDLEQILDAVDYRWAEQMRKRGTA